MNVHNLIACPTCHARVDQSCRTRAGIPTHPHGSRLAPRLCPCGESLRGRGRSPYCEPCQLENYRAAKRDYMRRKRAVDRSLAVVGGIRKTGPQESDKKSAPGRRANATCPGASPIEERERPTMRSLPCPSDNPPPRVEAVA